MRLEAMLRAAYGRLIRPAAPDKSAAGAVRTAAAELYVRLTRAGPEGDVVAIRAPWRGLGTELLPVGGWVNDRADAVSLRVTLDHRRVDEMVLAREQVTRSSEACVRSVLRTLERWAATLDKRIADVAATAAAAYETATDARRVVDGYRFDRADELARAEARFAEIETALESSVQERWRRRR